MYESLIDNLMSESGSERFQEGLFTAFYVIEKCGLKQEQIFKIFTQWEENNSLGNEDYINLKENYLEFCKQYESTRELYNSIKKIR